MLRSIATVALLSAVVAALWLLPTATPAAAQEGAAPAARSPGADAAGPAAGAAGPVAAALEAALEVGDAAAALALFAPDAQIKEGVAVLAAGPERVAAWVRGCLLPDVSLVPGSRRLSDGGATWAARDALGCYWRARPDGFRPAWDVAPAEGTLAVAVAGDRITTLTLVYSAAWEARLLTAQAAPFRTAQAAATARAAPTAVPPPSTQDRRTPSVGPWAVALGLSLAGLGLLTRLPRPRAAVARRRPARRV